MKAESSSPAHRITLDPSLPQQALIYTPDRRKQKSKDELPRLTPVGRFSSVSVSSSYSGIDSDYACGLRTDASVTCWGNVLGGFASSDSFSSVSAGSMRPCGISKVDGSMVCSTGKASIAGSFQAFNSGFVTDCGIRTDGSAVCSVDLETPQTGVFKAISVGYDLACAIEIDGTLVCWTFPCMDGSPIHNHRVRHLGVGSHREVDETDPASNARAKPRESAGAASVDATFRLAGHAESAHGAAVHGTAAYKS